MTDDVLDRVRAINPLPEGSAAPPFEVVLTRVHAAAPTSRRRRAVRLLVPVFSIAITILVLVVAVVDLRTNHQRVTRPAHVPTAPPRVPVAPTGGMQGLVSVWGAGFSSASDGVISVQQCLGCRNGNRSAHSTERYWLVTTGDGGQTWKLAARRYYIQQPLFVGQNGWSGGLQATGPQARGMGIAQYYVTHDGGRNWSVAPAAAPNEGGSVVSLAGGEVWATGLANQVAILHAPVAGSRLTATAAQPIHGNWTNVEVFAGGAGTAYVVNDNAPQETFVTHDNGQTWQHIAPPCSHGGAALLTAAYGETVWANCAPSQGARTTATVRSDNGGRSWQRLSRPIGAELRLQPVSARVAWALAADGNVLRTTDGGLTWRTAWSAADPRDAPLRTPVPRIAAGFSNLPILVAQTSNSAIVVTMITRGHVGQQAKLTNLVVYRTTDGGQTWRPYVVPLASR
jgi:photosystem II stability/assembly factor-like uncharacterized protein